eukprot:CAMPEP_0119274494 /NCGR_PEP_ID=MMETSP1329-20130426/12204_1 /TAXON_ID=114041 /ORGANISM="Genus nov. species nov., Strain RCC1024" /LENGTH=968 /DNA_ID=CAMNT_0007274817 /DNA_START=51 /DNA_END=2957 /DNA_ORIENTATION=-
MRGLLLALAASLGHGDLVINPAPQVIYGELTDKLRIGGSGFSGLGAEPPTLGLLPKLPPGALNVTVKSDTLMTVGLKKGNEWPHSDDPENAGQTMYLMSLKKAGEDAELLDNPVPVAQVLDTPSVQRGFDKVIYMTGSTKFNINGTGFRSKSMNLVFDPPLEKDVDYLLKVRSATCMQLTLRTGKKWRSDGQPGPLKLRRINTGGGYLRIDAKYGGVTVAEVQVDLGAHGVRVETTAADQRVYQSSPRLKVTGSGFNDTAGLNTLKWGNSLRGKGINYTITEATKDSLSLDLAAGSKWRLNPNNLPSPMLLLAVNAGAGLVPVGPTEAKKGRRVATVYEDPSVNKPSSKKMPKLFQTHSHELWITGTGFARGTTSLVFKAEGAKPDGLKVNEDYVLTVFNRTHCLVSLLDGKKWAEKPGKLFVSRIDTGAGVVGARYALTMGRDDLKMDVQVAEVVADAEDHPTGLAVARTSGQSVYQTGAVKILKITGQKLCATDKPDDIALEFSPALDKSKYVFTSATATEIALKRKPAHPWRADPGTLSLVSIQCPGGPKVELGGGAGVAVATVLADPTIEANPTRSIYLSQTKRLTIRGSGFALYSDAQLTLEPTPRSAYTVASVQNSAIVIELKAGQQWVPKGFAKDAGKLPALRVTRINTGAGMVNLANAAHKDGVVVAAVVADPEGEVCDNSCEFANDGICDDGSALSRAARKKVKEGGDWQDDLYGNYYYGEENYDDDFHEYDDDYYGAGYDYYNYGYGEEDAYGGAAVCAPGTDCDDCSAARVAGLNSPNTLCDNSCAWARDGVCDDERTQGPCRLGTDCLDCGPIGASNFTSFKKTEDGKAQDDDQWWDDDAKYWDDDYEWDDASEFAKLEYDDDGKPIAHIRSTAHPKESKEPRVIGEPGAGGLFVLALTYIVYTTGFVFCCGGVTFVVSQKQRGRPVWSALPTLDPGMAETKGPEKIGITPDRTFS